MTIDLLHEEEYAELSKRVSYDEVKKDFEKTAKEELHMANKNYRNRSFQVLLTTLAVAFATILIALIVLIQV